MTAFIPLILAGAIIWLLKLVLFERPPKEPPVSTSIKAAVKYGELEVFIHYESNPTLPKLERCIQLWAIDRTERRISRAFQLELEEEVRREFPAFDFTISRAVITANAPEEPGKPPTYAENLVAEGRTKKAAALSVMEDAGLTPDDLDASIDVEHKRYAKGQIRRIYHHPDHA